MNSAEIFAAGYAMPLYNIDNARQTFLFRDEVIDIWNAFVPLRDVGGFHVARIEDVRSAVK